MLFFLATRRGGEVERIAVDGHREHAATDFTAAWSGLPLWARRGYWVRDGVAYPTEIAERSVARDVGLWWGIALIVFAAAGAPLALAWLLLLVPAGALLALGVRAQAPLTPRELRRRGFAYAAYGLHCPPERLLPATRATLRADLDTWWRAHGGRDPEDVARFGARDGAEATAAYLILALAALAATDPKAAAALAAAADRIVDGTVEPSAIDGPFRIAPQAASAGPALRLAIAPEPPPVELPDGRVWWKVAGAVSILGACGLVMFAVAGKLDFTNGTPIFALVLASPWPIARGIRWLTTRARRGRIRPS